MQKNAANKANNKAINKTDEDFEKIVAVNKNKRIKTICQKHFPKLPKMKNTKSKIKPIKIGKQPGTTYCFGCKILPIILGQKK